MDFLEEVSFHLGVELKFANDTCLGIQPARRKEIPKQVAVIGFLLGIQPARRKEIPQQAAIFGLLLGYLVCQEEVKKITVSLLP